MNIVGLLLFLNALPLCNYGSLTYNIRHELCNFEMLKFKSLPLRNLPMCNVAIVVYIGSFAQFKQDKQLDSN